MAWPRPSHSAVIFFGLLVHQTIEEVHRLALDGHADTLTDHARWPGPVSAACEQALRLGASGLEFLYSMPGSVGVEQGPPRPARVPASAWADSRAG